MLKNYPAFNRKSIQWEFQLKCKWRDIILLKVKLQENMNEGLFTSKANREAKYIYQKVTSGRGNIKSNKPLPMTTWNILKMMWFFIYFFYIQNFIGILSTWWEVKCFLFQQVLKYLFLGTTSFSRIQFSQMQFSHQHLPKFQKSFIPKKGSGSGSTLNCWVRLSN